MSRGKTCNAVYLVVLAGIAAVVFIRHGTLSKLRSQNVSLRSQAEQLQNLRRESARFPSEDAPARDLSPEEFRELLRLRGEMALLRSELTQAAAISNAAAEKFWEESALRQDNSRLWTNVGAATPEAALQTLLWSLSNSNCNYATGLFELEIIGPASPFASKVIHGNMADHIREDIMPEWSTNLQAMEIISAEPIGSDDVELKLWKTTRDGNRTKRRAKLRRVGDQWKFVILASSEADAEHVHFQFPFGVPADSE